MGEFTVHVDTPQGTSLEGTTEIAQSIVKEIGEQEGVAHVAYLAGADRYNHFHVFVLPPARGRAEGHAGAGDRARATDPGAASRPIAPIVHGAQPARRRRGGSFAIQASPARARTSTSCTTTRSRLLAKAQATPSLVDAKTDYSNASPEVQVAVDRARAADLGVRMSTVGNTLRLMVSGDDEISTYREGGEQYPVKIRVLESQRRDIETIGKLTVASLDGRPVRIDNIAQLERGFGPTQHHAHRTGSSRSTSAPTSRPATRSTRRRTTCAGSIAGLHMPPGYSARMQGQTQILDETTDNLMMAIALASIFVYMVLAAQFESFVQPIIIMLVLPLSVPFALFTIWATGRTLNLWSALGILLLFGIVKKNSILQVDYTNVLRARGVPLQRGDRRGVPHAAPPDSDDDARRSSRA